jgi:3-isopropylmalate dehydrogenase
MKKNIAVLPGDGIGPEITAVAVSILKKIAQEFDHEFTFTEGLIGAAAIDGTGNPFPEETHKLCLASGAILFGAIGDPKYDNDPSAKVRPEQGLLAMRKALVLFANVRPIFTFPSTIEKSPLKPEIINGTDFVVIRELIGGIYFGKRGRNKDRTKAFDTSEYAKHEIERVAAFAFELAKNRNNKLTVVDKANVLETSRLWRETVQNMQQTYPTVTIEHMFVDNAAMQIIKRPSEFDVIVTENMFGDILTDEASVITGSIGMLPSASIGEKTSLYEPIHGSFPKAAGLNIANPIGSILSAAMLLEYSFGLKKERDSIYNAVENVLADGYGTKDITNDKIIGTKELGEKILTAI